MLRKEHSDVVYRTEEEKFRNAATEIKNLQGKGQPVLVGTISVEKSERLSGLLKKMGVKHEVLNAKHHEREALIVAQAGRKGAVTVSTNMAGRGTDILLGGNPEFMAKEALRKQGKDPDQLQISAVGTPERTEWDAALLKYKRETDQEHDDVVAAGGLHILGTERHESRRIDNQLRGRAGRQGDPGSSRFYLSLQDDLLRIFGGERMQNLMLRLGMEEDVPIESKLITKRIAAAQKAVEVQNFEARKHLLEYDDVMNKQRQAVYGMRRQLLEGLDQKERVLEMVRGALGAFIDLRCPEGTHPDTYDVSGLRTDVLSQFGYKIEQSDVAGLQREAIEEVVFEHLAQKYQQKEDLIGSDLMRQSERWIMLKVIDDQWKDHLLSMDHLKEGIGLRGYAQQDPLVAYKRESFDMFEAMMLKFQEDTVRFLFRMQIVGPDGQPINAAPEPPRSVPPAPPVESAAQPFNGNGNGAQPREISIPVRQPSTTIDALEKEFHRKKQRELAVASRAGAGESSQPAQRHTGDKVGRNDPCPCGSGKKYKKCHGIEK
jgi:preprotein translocase subunit SecA